MTLSDPTSNLATDEALATLGAMPPLAELEERWRALEANSTGSFFTSWTWIGCWLALSDSKPLLFCVQQMNGDQRDLALAVVTPGLKKLGPWEKQLLWLNASGRAEEDCIFTEFNDVLAAKGFEARAHALLWAHLAEGNPAWTGISWRGFCGDPKVLGEELGLALGQCERREAPFVNLTQVNQVRQTGGDYLALVSRNTRQQITRAERLLQEAGPLAIEKAMDVDQGLDWLGQLVALQEKRFNEIGRDSSLKQPFMQRFLTGLITVGSPRGEVEVVKISGGGEDFGFLINFIFGGVVANYQSGFVQYDNARIKPGLVAHAQAVRAYADQGLARYSFLAGHARYKESLATGSEALYWMDLQKPSLALTLERTAARVLAPIRSRLRKGRSM